MRSTKSTNCLQSEIYFQSDTICDTSPKKKSLSISNLQHSRLIDCTRKLHPGALLGFISGLRAIKMIKEQLQ